MSDETMDPHGLIALFDEPGVLLEAVRAAREAGYRRMDAFSPHPVDGLAEALGARGNRVGVVALLCAVAGGTGAWLLQSLSAYDFPFNTGGEPIYSWPAFVIIAFEMTMLGAVLGAVVTMLVLNGLPRPYHPLFDADIFERAAVDGYLLCIEAEDPRFDAAETGRFLRGQGATTVVEVPT
jgi:hypothetical protein